MTPLKVIKWWERRRPTYNLIVGVALVLLVCLALAWNSVFGAPQSEVDGDGCLLALLGPMVLANFCYTLGWLLDAPKKFFDRKYGQGPGDTVMLFRLGLGFSIALIYTPPLVWAAVCLFQRLQVIH